MKYFFQGPIRQGSGLLKCSFKIEQNWAVIRSYWIIKTFLQKGSDNIIVKLGTWYPYSPPQKWECFGLSAHIRGTKSVGCLSLSFSFTCKILGNAGSSKATSCILLKETPCFIGMCLELMEILSFSSFNPVGNCGHSELCEVSSPTGTDKTEKNK